MIEVNSIDAGPGEVEILTLAANYVAGRLFTARQQKSMVVLIDVTRQAVREPVSRDMLAPKKAVIGSKRPDFFEMTVSTGAGIRDAAEVIAHELLHIAQAMNGRLLITSKMKKVNRRRQKVEFARWMGGKPIMIDELAWHDRPWEVEACHWQIVLVNEFLQMSMGQPVDQPVQKPKKQQMALYPMIMPVATAPLHQEPAFDSETASSVADPIAANGSAIDAHFGGDSHVPVTAHVPVAAPADDIDAPADAMQVNDADMVSADAGLNDADDDALMAQLAADLAVKAPVDMEPAGAVGSDFDEARAEAFEAAPFNIELPASPVIDVDVPGLEVPRQLEREAMDRKLMELRARGLAAAQAADLSADFENRL